MEVPKPTTPSRREVMEAFEIEEKYLPKKVERKSLELDENLTQRDLVSSDIVEKYEQARMDDPEFIETTSNHPDYLARFDSVKTGEKLLNVQLLKGGDSPVSLAVLKHMGHYKLKGEEEENLSHYQLKVLKGDLSDKNAGEISKTDYYKREGIGGFVLDPKEDGIFDIPDRFVNPQYRGPQNESNERMGNILLQACEQIVQNHANKKGKEKTIEVSSAKLDTIMWMHTNKDNGYKTKTKDDEDRLKKLLSADKEKLKDLKIVNDLFIWEKDKWKEGINVYEERKGDTGAFVITFEKKIEPNTNAMAEDVRRKVSAV